MNIELLNWKNPPIPTHPKAEPLQFYHLVPLPHMDIEIVEVEVHSFDMPTAEEHNCMESEEDNTRYIRLHLNRQTKKRYKKE
jgi:hypothetical protein